MVLECNGDEVPFEISINDSNWEAIGDGETILAVDSGELDLGSDESKDQSLFIKIIGTPKKAGTYQATLSFLAEIIDTPNVEIITEGTTATNVRIKTMSSVLQTSLKEELKGEGISGLTDADIDNAVVMEVNADSAGTIKFNTADITEDGKTILFYHKSSTNGWELVGQGSGDSVECTFSDFSPVVMIKKEGSSNPYATKVASVQKLYDVGEANLTDDDIVTVNGIDCYVLQVDEANNKAELITKRIYDTRFNLTNTRIQSEYNYATADLKMWMDQFYTNLLEENELIIESNIISYYTDNNYSNDLTTFTTENLTQHCFALDGAEAKIYASKFRWNPSNININNLNMTSFWTSAGYDGGGDGGGGSSALSVDSCGYIYNCSVNSEDSGARPAFWITLD